MKQQHAGLAALLTVIALSGFGCGSITNKITEKVAEKATEAMIENSVEKQSGGNVDLDISKGQLNFKGQDGTSVSYGSDLKLPTDFPSVVPVYSGAKITATTTTKTDSTVTLTSSDAAADILTWYEGQLSGWEKESAFDSEGYSMRTFKKGQETITLAVGSADETRSITIHYQMEATTGEQTPS